MALHYAKQADLRQKMEGVSDALSTEMNRRQLSCLTKAKIMSNLAEGEHLRLSNRSCHKNLAG